MQLHSLKLQILLLLRARSSLTFRLLSSTNSLWNAYVNGKNIQFSTFHQMFFSNIAVFEYGANSSNKFVRYIIFCIVWGDQSYIGNIFKYQFSFTVFSFKCYRSQDHCLSWYQETVNRGIVLLNCKLKDALKYWYFSDWMIHLKNLTIALRLGW